MREEYVPVDPYMTPKQRRRQEAAARAALVSAGGAGDKASLEKEKAPAKAPPKAETTEELKAR